MTFNLIRSQEEKQKHLNFELQTGIILNFIKKIIDLNIISELTVT